MNSNYASMDYWFSYVAVPSCGSSEYIENMYAKLQEEFPRILSVVAERACTLQCQHCIFQSEASSAIASSSSRLGECATTIAKQMGVSPIVVHEGRIFRPSHLPWLKSIRTACPTGRIGMIDNGSYVQHINKIERSGFQFDWLDISIDGPEKIHNHQRMNPRAFADALVGIEAAQEVIRSGGKVTSLFTLTALNHASILETCAIMPSNVAEWHVTTMTPARPEIAHLAITQEQFQLAWRQIVKANQQRRVYFRMYVANDLLKLATAVGKKKFLAAVEQTNVDDTAMQFIIDGVLVTYYPQSISPSETFVLDADSCYRAPYAIAYTLKELRCGVSRFGEDLTGYTVSEVNLDSNFQALYRQSVANWKGRFGLAALEREREIFANIQKLP